MPLRHPHPSKFLVTNTGSTGVNVALTLILAANITSLATTSREVWAFARDGGIPGHRWISRASPGIKAPTRSTPTPPTSQVKYNKNVPFQRRLNYLLPLFHCLLNQLASTVAFNIMISLNLIAFLGTYMLSVGCLLLKSFRNELLPPARFNLGRFGLPIKPFAFCYSVVRLVFSCFPDDMHVDAGTANWGPAIWGGVLGIAAVAYAGQGRWT